MIVKHFNPGIMEKKVYYKIEYEGGTMSGAVRRYDSFKTAVRVARSYVTRMLKKRFIGDAVAVRVSTMVNFREETYIYIF